MYLQNLTSDSRLFLLPKFQPLRIHYPVNDLIALFNELSPFATLALLVYLVLQGRNAHVERDDVLKLELVKLVSAAVSNIEASTQALRQLKTAEEETQTLVTGTRRELQAHHAASADNFAALRSAVESVPARTDEKLAPRFQTLQELLATANRMVSDIAEDVRARAQKTAHGGDGAGTQEQENKKDAGGDEQKAPSADGGSEAANDQSAKAQREKAKEA